MEEYGRGPHGDRERPQTVVVINQVFPLLYPLLSFVILARVHDAYPLLSPAVFALAFVTLTGRVVIIQRRQEQERDQTPA